jgi:hypothetical protein
MVLLATAPAFRCAVTSGRSIFSPTVRRLFGVRHNERPACFLSMGRRCARQGQRSAPAVKTTWASLSERPLTGLTFCGLNA